MASQRGQGMFLLDTRPPRVAWPPVPLGTLGQPLHTSWPLPRFRAETRTLAGPGPESEAQGSHSALWGPSLRPQKTGPLLCHPHILPISSPRCPIQRVSLLRASQALPPSSRASKEGGFSHPALGPPGGCPGTRVQPRPQCPRPLGQTQRALRWAPSGLRLCASLITAQSPLREGPQFTGEGPEPPPGCLEARDCLAPGRALL